MSNLRSNLHSKAKEKIIQKGLLIRKPKKRNTNWSFEIGGMNAELEDVKDKRLKSFLKDLGETLLKQLDCDGIEFKSIEFQRWWQKSK